MTGVAIMPANARSTTMTTGSTTACDGDASLTDGTPLEEVLDVATGHRTQPVYHGEESDEDVPILVAFGGLDGSAYGAPLVLLADWHAHRGDKRKAAHR